MSGKDRIDFPARWNTSLEDRLQEEQRKMAMPSTGSVRIYGSWGEFLEKRPLDSLYFTALRGRACLLVSLSAQSVPRPDIIKTILKEERPWMFCANAFLQGAFPILRCHLVMPDNPRDPFFLEAPLSIRDGDVQDFCRAAMADEHLDVLLGHELLGDGMYMLEMRGPGIAELLRREVSRALKALRPQATKADFQASARMMERAFASGSAGVERAHCVRLRVVGKAKHSTIVFGDE